MGSLKKFYSAKISLEEVVTGGDGKVSYSGSNGVDIDWETTSGEIKSDCNVSYKDLGWEPWDGNGRDPYMGGDIEF